MKCKYAQKKSKEKSTNFITYCEMGKDIEKGVLGEGILDSL